MGSMIITVFEDGPNCQLKGLAIKQATEMATREATQQVTPIQQALMIHDMIAEIRGNNPLRFNNGKIATWFRSQSWAPKEWGQERFTCAALKVHSMFIQLPKTYKILKKMNLMFGKAGLNDSISKLADIGRTVDGNPQWIEIFMKTMLFAIKRGEWTNVQSCTVTNMQGRSDRGNISTPAVCLFLHHLAIWFVKRYEISAAVSSKMMNIEAFDANLLCAKDAEQREEQVDQTWQHNVRDDKENGDVFF